MAVSLLIGEVFDLTLHVITPLGVSLFSGQQRKVTKRELARTFSYSANKYNLLTHRTRMHVHVHAGTNKIEGHAELSPFMTPCCRIIHSMISFAKVIFMA